MILEIVYITIICKLRFLKWKRFLIRSETNLTYGLVIWGQVNIKYHYVPVHCCIGPMKRENCLKSLGTVPFNLFIVKDAQLGPTIDGF